MGEGRGGTEIRLLGVTEASVSGRSVALGGAHQRSENFSQYCDRAVDALFARAVAASGSEASVLWAALDRRVVCAAPAVPLVNRRVAVFVSDRVGNVQHHPHLGPLLDQFWVR